MRSWRLIAPLVLVVLGLGVLAPVLLLRHAEHADARAGDRAGGATISARTSSSPTASRTNEDAPSSAQAAGSAITTTSRTYFGRPYETVQIEGRYSGVRRSTRLRVEVQQPEGWTPFPLPAVTRPSGEFKAYVEMGGPGVYRLRILDPRRRATSPVLELVVF